MLTRTVKIEGTRAPKFGQNNQIRSITCVPGLDEYPLDPLLIGFRGAAISLDQSHPNARIDHALTLAVNLVAFRPQTLLRP